MGSVIDSVMWTIVGLFGFGALVLMARVAVAQAFGSVDVREAERQEASYYESLAREWEARALRWELLHAPEQAEECRETARRYYRRAEAASSGQRT